ncbi:PadR family transcriptional regulator [Streptomyces sp. NRRL B-1347]|uniref:PadR family transcriptional regulator n=1 Tax=Streptomyces sp. NRRL B-1347 TaxID=1476877 RepID=UPI000690B740|nr:PadR family transcriptional regulator [Streptomyces sp. NRRL B-1347]
MNSTRLFVLGTLVSSGPMHGHQIRRQAQLDRTELWTSVKPGSLYGALHRMEVEGVVRAVRTERSGQRPARTVYEITDAGRREYDAHRDEALRTVRLPPDPVDLALQNTDDLPPEHLRVLVEDRCTELESQLRSWMHLWQVADIHLGGLERMSFRHTELRLRAELQWHQELLDGLDKALSEPAPQDAPPVGESGSAPPT